MIRRIVRILFRVAGWLLTPLVVILAAFLGATIAAVVAPALSATAALILVLLVGLVSATVGMLLWIRLLKGSPELQEALAVTPEGVPREEEVELILSGGTPDTGAD